MDLIALSDIYGDVDALKELIERLGSEGKEKRMFVVAGDIGIMLNHQEYSEIFLLLANSSKYVLYVPGDADIKNLNVNLPNVINLDRSNFFLQDNGVKLGFLGLGGAPKHSVREDESLPNTYDESTQVVIDGILSSLKINLEKVMHNNPDLLILVTHSPPYGIADRSTQITLKEFVILEEILLDTEYKEEKGKRATMNPRRLGSKAIKEFVDYYKPDIHIFGHVHKQGGKVIQEDGRYFFNVSHFSLMPYKLTGRKFLKIRIKEEGKFGHSFDSLVIKELYFKDFLERYL
ncbi:MAG: metallophosphoesterase [Nitrososphaerales archaeon]